MNKKSWGKTLKILGGLLIVFGLLVFLGFALTINCFECPGFQWTLSYKNISNHRANTSGILDIVNLIRTLGIILSFFGASILFGGIYLSNKRVLACLISIFFFLLIVFLFIQNRHLENISSSALRRRTIGGMNQIRSDIELYKEKNGSYKNYEKENNYLKIKKHIETVGAEGFTFNIAEQGKEYCAKVKLQKIGEWWCIDSLLTSKEYNKDPACSATHFACD